MIIIIMMMAVVVINNSSMKAENRTKKLCLMKKAGSLGSIRTVLGGLVKPFLALVHNIILLRL
jgi:hypothetical protein